MNKEARLLATGESLFALVVTPGILIAVGGCVLRGGVNGVGSRYSTAQFSAQQIPHSSPVSYWVSFVCLKYHFFSIFLTAVLYLVSREIVL